MSEKLPNMLESTIAKLREMVDVNSVVGSPITTPDGVTIIPISKISVGFGGGGSDFASKNAKPGEMPFGGGAGAGVNITPVAFLVVRGESVRMLPVAEPASTSMDRLIEQLPELDSDVSVILCLIGHDAFIVVYLHTPYSRLVYQRNYLFTFTILKVVLISGK